MKFPFIVNPDTGKPDEMITVTVLTISAVLFRFVLDGVTLEVFDHKLVFGHVDALVYAAVLAPVLGTHGFMSQKKIGVKNGIDDEK